MSSIAIITIAIAFLLLLLLMGRNRQLSPPPGLESEHDSETGARMPPLTVLYRCFSVDDIEFTARLRAPMVQQLLLSERRRLALQWISRTRHEVRRVFRLHLRAARHSADLRPGAEMRLVFDGVVFLILSQMLVAVVYFYGPFRSRSFLQSIRSLANVLADLSGRIVVGPAALERS